MGRESPLEGAMMPLKRKSLQELTEDPRQCSSTARASPVGWAAEEDSDAGLGCARKARIEAADAVEALASAAAASPPATAPPTAAQQLASSMAQLGPGRASLPSALLRTCGPGGAGGGACSMSVFCSASFGALEDEPMAGDTDSEAASAARCGAATLERAGSSGPEAGSAVLPAAPVGPVGSAAEGMWVCEPQTATAWPEVPDDILRKVLDKLPPSYLRVVRLVCRQWEGAAGRLLRHLRPESLAGKGVGARFCHLHSLDLSNCMTTVEFVAPKRLRLQSRLTDDLLAELAPLSKLRELSLRNCNSLTGAGLLHLRGLPELRVLNLTNCSRLSDEGLACMAQLPHVETVNLQGCALITDVGLARLWSMPRLRHVICHNGITDVGLRILTGLPGLERLALRDCRSVSTAGVMALLQMPSLKRVVISKCPQVTMETLCGVSNLHVVSDLASLAAAARNGFPGPPGGAAAAAPGPAAAGVAGALPQLLPPLLPAAAPQLPAQQQQQQQQQQGLAAAGAAPALAALVPAPGVAPWHNPAMMPDLHLLLADLN